MLKHMPWIRTALLLVGLLVIAKINLEPHMPFYGFQEFGIDLSEPVVHTKETAEACVIYDKSEHAIPVIEVKNGKPNPTGVFVEVTTFGVGHEVQKPGVDNTSKPTLHVIVYIFVMYIFSYFISWIAWFINKRRRPAA